MNFEQTFGEEGRRFADALRRLLPEVLQPDANRALAARAELQAIANKVSFRLRAASTYWLKYDLPRAVGRGQARAARQVGVRFGGVNMNLVNRLAQDLAPRLAAASESVQPYLSMALRKTTAMQIQRDTAGLDQAAGASVFDPAVNRSLITGALNRDTLKQAQARLMQDLGLDQGDNVLMLSGRMIEASVYAKMVARTRRAEAENQGAAYEYESQGFQFIETSSHAGVDPDDICYFLQGKVWALTPNDLGIPLLPAEYGLPPWHPNCVHTFGAWIPDLNGGQKAVNRVVDSHLNDAKALAAWDGGTKK